MNNIFSNIGKLTLMLTCFLSGCSKTTELHYVPKQKYFVTGQVENTYCKLYIGTIQNPSIYVQDAIVSIVNGGVTTLLTFQDSFYTNNNSYIKPGSNFDINIEINGDKATYSDNLPDSISTNLILDKIDGFEYKIGFNTSITDPSANFYYLKSGSERGSVKDYGYYNYLTEIDFAITDNPITTNTFGICADLIEFGYEYQVSHKRVKKNVVEHFEYLKSRNQHVTDPLYINYPSSLDQILGDYIFRLSNGTNIESNKVKILDVSSPLIEINIYDKNGIPLSNALSNITTIFLNSNFDQNRSAFFQYDAKNPNFITLNRLAQLEKNNCKNPAQNYDITKYLNQPIGVIASYRISNQEFYADGEEVILSNFNDKQIINLRLKQQ